MHGVLQCFFAPNLDIDGTGGDYPLGTMRDEARAAKMHDRGGRSRCLWESLQTIKGLRATKETMPSFRSNDLGLGPIIASDASGAWCLGSHTGRVRSGHVSGGKTQRAATRARPAGRTRIEGCGSVQGLHPQYYSKGGVARGEYSVHEVSRLCKQVDGAADSVFTDLGRYCIVQPSRGDQLRQVPQGARAQSDLTFPP